MTDEDRFPFKFTWRCPDCEGSHVVGVNSIDAIPAFEVWIDLAHVCETHPEECMRRVKSPTGFPLNR